MTSLNVVLFFFSVAVVCNSYSKKMTINTKKRTSDNGPKLCCYVGFYAVTLRIDLLLCSSKFSPSSNDNPKSKDIKLTNKQKKQEIFTLILINS